MSLKREPSTGKCHQRIVTILRSVCLHVCLCLYVRLSFCRSVRLSVCLSARIPQKPNVQASRNFLYMLPVAAIRSSSDDSAMSYVFPVLWMTTAFHIKAPMGQNETMFMFRPNRQVATLGTIFLSTIADLYY